jgi:UDP-N-acetylmuramate-alanine ligase
MTLDLEAIRQRVTTNIVEIVANPREYYRIQQVLRDRADLLAECDRLRSELAAAEAFKQRVAKVLPHIRARHTASCNFDSAYYDAECTCGAEKAGYEAAELYKEITNGQ